MCIYEVFFHRTTGKYLKKLHRKSNYSLKVWNQFVIVGVNCREDLQAQRHYYFVSSESVEGKPFHSDL